MLVTKMAKPAQAFSAARHTARLFSTSSNIPSTYIIASASAAIHPFTSPLPKRTPSRASPALLANPCSTRRSLTSLVQAPADPDPAVIRREWVRSPASRQLPWDFANWLGGIVDACGAFTYKGKGSNLGLHLTFPSFDKDMALVLHEKLRTGVLSTRLSGKSIRYTIKARPMLKATEALLQGHLRHSKRIPTFHRSATELQLPLVEPFLLHPQSPWFAGFFALEGDIDYKVDKHNTEDRNRPQLYIKVNDRNWIDLVPWKANFGGEILFDTGSDGKYHWIIYSQKDIMRFVATLDRQFPSAATKRFDMVEKFYFFRDNKAYHIGAKHNFEWLKFEREWKEIMRALPTRLDHIKADNSRDEYDDGDD